MTAAALPNYSLAPSQPMETHQLDPYLLDRASWRKELNPPSVATTRQSRDGKLVLRANWFGSDRRLGIAAACLGLAEIVVRELIPSGALVLQ